MLLPGQTSSTVPRPASSALSRGSSAERTPCPMRVTGRSAVAAPTPPRPHRPAGGRGAAAPFVFPQPIGRREIRRPELRLVAAHAEADDVAVRLAHHGAHHRERPLRSAMADADDDDAAFDAMVAARPVD